MLNHSEFISDPDKQVASLRTVDRDLPNQLIKALDMKLLTHLADARVPGPQDIQLLIEKDPEITDICARRGCRRDVTNPELFVFNDFLGR